MLFRQAFAVILLTLLAFSDIAFSQQKEQRIALVIGNSAYKASPLKNPVNDARDMANSLRGYGFTVIERNNLTVKQIGSTLREFRSKLSAGSVALVFYAGHGIQIKGENYLPAVDADIVGEEDVPNQSLSTRQIMDVLADAKSRMNLVFLDACRDNPFARSFRSSSRGLSRENAPSGTLISFATIPGSTAADGDGRNGLYTSVLLQQIKNTDQPIEQVLKRVVTGVNTASKGQQEPWMEGSIEGDFCFGQCGVSSQSTSPINSVSKEQKDPEEEAWNAATRANSLVAYQTYLSSDPSGRYRSAAQIAMSAFDKTASASPYPNTSLQTSSVPKIIKLGHVAPLTGAIAHLGKDNENGAQLAIEELNRRANSTTSLLIGSQTPNFQLVTEDDAANPKQALEAAQRLIRQGVSGVVGHLNSGTSIPASKLYNDAGIPQLSPSSTNPKLTRQGFSNAFRLVIDDAALGSFLGRIAVRKYGAKKILLIDDRTAYGAGLADEFSFGVTSAGGVIIKRDYVNDRSIDLNAVMNSIRNTNPDLIFFGGMDSSAGIILKEMRNNGFRTKIMGGDGICTSELVKISNFNATDGQVICAEAGGVEATYRKKIDDFGARYKAQFGYDVKLYAPYAYDAVMIIAEAMRRAKSSDPSVYRQVMYEGVFDGITGAVEFDSKGDPKNPALTLYTYMNNLRTLEGVYRLKSF